MSFPFFSVPPVGEPAADFAHPLQAVLQLQQTQPQLILGFAELGALLGRTVSTLQTQRTRNPESLPPAIMLPGTKGPRWLLSDVLAWAAQFRETKIALAREQATLLATTDDAHAAPPRRRGHPGKAALVAKAAIARKDGGAQ